MDKLAIILVFTALVGGAALVLARAVGTQLPKLLALPPQCGRSRKGKNE